MRVALLIAFLLLAGCLPAAETDAVLEDAPSGYVFDEEPTPEPSDLGTASATEEATATLAVADETESLENEEPSSAEEAAAEAEAEEEAEPEGPRRVDMNAERRSQCERRGGRFSRTGAGLFYCVRDMRDANKSCDSSRDCQGECLARSRTCAPFAPLLGCNEVLTTQGIPSTVCVN